MMTFFKNPIVKDIFIKGGESKQPEKFAVPADMLFQTAVDGESAAQHFIERLLFDVFSFLNKVILRKRGNSGNNQSNILN